MRLGPSTTLVSTQKRMVGRPKSPKTLGVRAKESADEICRPGMKSGQTKATLRKKSDLEVPQTPSAGCFWNEVGALYNFGLDPKKVGRTTKVPKDARRPS